MKSFNISKQNKDWAQAYKKEYINQLWNQTNSLYEYLHYYNPEWRLLEDNNGYYTKTDPNLLTNKASLEDTLLPNHLIFTVLKTSDSYSSYCGIWLTRIEFKKNNIVTETLEFKRHGNYLQFIDMPSTVSREFSNCVFFLVDPNISEEYGYFTLSIPDCDEIIIYTATGQQMCDAGFALDWGAYYVRHKCYCRLNVLDEDHLIYPEDTYPFQGYSDPNQEALNAQFTFSMTIPEKEILYINKLQYRWGYKNTSDHVFWYGSNYTSALDIGATIYKKDSYDISNILNPSDLDHYILFEAALAQYITWTISTGVDASGKAALIYTYHLSNELDFGLQYNIQVVESTPRYFYDGVYKIKYTNDNFDSTTLLDYININVKCGIVPQEEEELELEPDHGDNKDYQHWCGATTIFPQTVYVDNNKYEELIADTVLYERPGKTSEYQVRFNKQSTNHPSIENKFEVIFS